MTDTPERPKSNDTQKINHYAKYSGIAFQMLATIGLGVYVGLKLDAWLQLQFPVWTLILSLGSVATSLYLLIKQVPKE
ncbi:MAG: AtpZ/AtpI family protein [Spirosomataceae bacterium]